MKSFWHPLLFQKQFFFGAFPTSFNVLPPMLPNYPWFEKYEKHKIFLTLMLAMIFMYFLVSFNIISYPMLQSLMFWCLSLLEKEISMFNLAPVVFWTSFFYTPTTYWLFSFCHSLLAFLFFYYFLSFFILGVVCLNVFLLLTKFRSFLKQNTTQNWILTKDVQNKECYIG